MVFPTQEKLKSKRGKDKKIKELFVQTESWEEFCIKAAAMYGIHANSIFSKWKLAYIAINHGIFYVILPSVLLFISALSGICWFGTFAGILEKDVTLAGFLYLMFIIACSLITVMKTIKLFDFISDVKLDCGIT